MKKNLFTSLYLTILPILILSYNISLSDELPFEEGYGFGGNLSHAAIKDDYTFVCTGQLLYTLDRTSNDFEIAARTKMPRIANSMYIDGNYLFQTHNNYGFSIWDISNPLSPSRLKTVAGVYETFRNMAVFGNFFYLPIPDRGMNIYNISDPADPQKVDWVSPDGMKSAYIYQDKLYVLTKNNVLKIFDLTTPSNPTEIGSINLQDTEHVFVTGDYAYISGGGRYGFHIVDVSDPENPAQINHGQLNFHSEQLIVEGNTLIAIEQIIDNSPPMVYAFDISDPENPLKLDDAQYKTGYFTNICFSGTKAYITNDISVDCLLELDFSTPGNLNYSKAFKSALLVNSMEIRGVKLIVGTSGLACTYDISNPNEPVFDQELDGVTGFNIKTSGDMLFTLGTLSLNVYDISNMSDITSLGSYPVNNMWGAYDFQVKGDYIYIIDASLSNPMHVVEISSMEKKGELTVDGANWLSFIYGNDDLEDIFVGTANSEGGELLTISLENPREPVISNRHEIPNAAGAFAASSDRGYLAYNDGAKWELDILDISDTDTPTTLLSENGDGTLVELDLDVDDDDTELLATVRNAQSLWFKFNMDTVRNKGSLKNLKYELGGKLYRVVRDDTTKRIIFLRDAGDDPVAREQDEGWVNHGEIFLTPEQVPAKLYVDRPKVDTNTTCINEIYNMQVDDKVKMGEFSLHADPSSDWFVSFVVMKISNYRYIHKVWIKNETAEPEEWSWYLINDSSVVMDEAFVRLDDHIVAGETNYYSVWFEFDEYQCPLKHDPVFSYMVEEVNDIFARPLNDEYAENYEIIFRKEVISDVFVGYCVENTDTEILYLNIEDALAEALANHTLEVCEGTYRESSLDIEVANLTLRSKEGPDNTIITSELDESNLLTVTAESALITGFTFLGGGNGIKGINLNGIVGTEISYNIFKDCRIGITAYTSNNLSVWNNFFEDCDKSIFSVYSNEGIYHSNTIRPKDKGYSKGISIHKCNKIIIRENSIDFQSKNHQGTSYGIDCSMSEACRFNNNSISGANQGIRIMNSRKLLIRSNNISFCSSGIYMFTADFCSAQRNTLQYNNIGVDLLSGFKININNNNISRNNQYGIRADDMTELYYNGNNFSHNKISNVRLKDCRSTNGEVNRIRFAGVKFQFSNEKRKDKTLNNELYGGIVLDNSDGLLYGNLFSKDSSAGVICLNGSSPVITNNNFSENYVYGILNLDIDAPVYAYGNYWNDPSGPSGIGGGSGEELSGNIEFEPFLENMVDVVVATVSDTIYVPRDTTDSLDVFIRNWADEEGDLTLTITEESDWLEQVGTINLTSSDTFGAHHLSIFLAPVQAGMQNIVNFSVTSSTNSEWTDETDVLLITYLPELDNIRIQPDTLILAPGDSGDFLASGMDQHGRSFEFDPNWEAETGGSINQDGMFTAGDEKGLFLITVMDVNTAIESAAYVLISDSASAVDDNKVSSLKIEVYPNPFSDRVEFRFGLDKPAYMEFTIHDVYGRKTATVFSGMVDSVENIYTWKPGNIKDGIYYYRVKSGNRIITGNIIYIR